MRYYLKKITEDWLETNKIEVTPRMIWKFGGEAFSDFVKTKPGDMEIVIDNLPSLSEVHIFEDKLKVLADAQREQEEKRVREEKDRIREEEEARLRKQKDEDSNLI